MNQTVKQSSSTGSQYKIRYSHPFSVLGSPDDTTRF